MHPDDNLRVPSIDAVTDWQQVGGETKNGSVRNGGATSGVVNGTEYKWPPLLSKLEDTNGIDGGYRNGKTRNNNDVYERYKYWPEDGDGCTKLGGNNNGSLTNNKGLLGVNGFPAELDPLTGVDKDGSRNRRESDEISQCGIGSCQPKWARSFATTHAFMVVFLLAWILQGMYYTYFVSTITTIERLFQIKSKTTGLLMSVVEIGQICTSLFLTYYAGRGHRPRWIACGMVVFAIASFVCTVPHFIYGDQLLQGHMKLSNNGKELSNDYVGTTNRSLFRSLSDAKQNLCFEKSYYENNSVHNLSTECSDDLKDEQITHSGITSIVLVIFTISLFTIGVGQTAVSTLGIPYIDDNVASRESPIYISITIGVRILGPAFGFILGSFCTRFYVNPFVDPGFGPTDPQWVGAWWMGLVLISACMVITSLAMFMFPRALKGNRIPPPAKLREIEAKKKTQVDEYKSPKFRDFPKAIKRQLNNDVLMFRTASSVLHLLPVAGLYTFLPKYLETQFQLTAHNANLFSGVCGIMFMGLGIVLSGIVILKFSPTARMVSGWIAFTALVYSVGMAMLMFIGCPMNDLAGFREVKYNPLTRFEPICPTSTECQCETEKFSPICGVDGVTYFSSCHAACTTVTVDDDNKIRYTNCGCVSNVTIIGDLDLGQAKAGFCDEHCQSFMIFVIVFSFAVFMHSTSEVGSMLLIMRCTDPKDKAMAMGVIQFAIGLFGNVPCPIIYGAVVDSACLVWETVCDKVGACSLYDGDTFRHFFLGATSFIMFLAFIMDLVVWKKSDRIDIDPESSNASETDYEKAADTPESSV